jgi:CRISPR-associated protein (TIGR03986 family)
MIKAPYNFVPLNKEVVTPFWADQISHDQPFKNGISGKLELELTAESPIYVRNGSVGDQSETSFNHFGGKYFIPGSSVKGMLRSAVEILSFGSLSDRVNDVTYSFRDFYNPEFEPSKIAKESLPGWLKKEDDKYIIYQAEKLGRISHEELDKKCPSNKSINTYYHQDRKDRSSEHKNTEFPLLMDAEFNFEFDREFEGRNLYKFSQDGEKGKVVLTGQPGTNVGKGKKKFEFVFFGKVGEFEVKDEVLKNFLLAYHDAENKKNDWHWRKKQLNGGSLIPIFFRKTDGKVIDFGLTQLYKITYKNSIGKLIQSYQKNDLLKRDMSDCIFGYSIKLKSSVENSKVDVLSLKGRVHIGHAFSFGNATPLFKRQEVLSSPSATYYPNYIKQEEQNGKLIGPNPRHKTMNNGQSILRGYKRFPIRTNEKIQINQSTNGNENIGCAPFEPLGKGAKFRTTIAYHNLRPEELGALISAITFHGTPGYFHSIGMAKPLGYGKIKVEVLNQEEQTSKIALGAFESLMEYELKGNWKSSEQLQEFLAMCKGSEKADNQLAYMPLADFATAKGKKKDDPKYALQNFSAISGLNDLKVNSYLSPQDYAQYIKELEQEKLTYMTSNKVSDPKAVSKTQIDLHKKELKDLITLEKEKLKELFILRKKEIDKIRIEGILGDEVAERERKRIQKVSEGLDFSKLNRNSRIYVEGLKIINAYIEAYHKKKLKDLSAVDGGLISVLKEKENLKKFLLEIQGLMSSKDKSKWKQEPFASNIFFKKVSEWIGTDEASELFKKL